MKKTTYLKTLLVAVCLCLGSMSAWADDAYFGSSTKECGAWDASSKSKNYILQKEGTIILNFTFSTNTDTEKYPTWQKWYTWLVDVSCNGWQFACRADNEAGSNWQGTLSPTITYSANFETAYTRDNMNGASVVLEISRSSDNEVTVLATTTKDETIWWKKEVITLGDGAGDKDMTFYLTCDNGYGEIHSVVGDNCVGTQENVTSWWNCFSDYYTINANKTLTLNFKNYSSKNENWSNFVTVITNDVDRGGTGYAEQVVLRVDDYGWGTYYDHSKFSNNYNWTSFKNDMDGASVELKVRRLDTKVAVKATYTTTSGQKYYQQYVYTSPSGTDALRVFLTTDNSHITNLSSSTADTPNSANEYLYTIKAVDGSDKDLKTFATGAYWTGESAITLAIPQYILSGTTLLGVAKQSDDYWYRVSVTPNAADFVHKVTYNNETISNVVYFSEAEDISGFSESTSDAITSRASGGKCARSGGSDKTLTTLSAGKYKVYVRGIADSNTRKVSVKAGDATVLDNWEIGNGTDQKTNAEFTLSSSTTITAACSATSSTGLDWVYIQKIAEAVTVSDAAYATYVSANDLDFTSTSIKAYTAKVNTSTGAIVLSEINKVPANTPVILYKDGGATENIPFATSTDAVGDNDLHAGTGAAVATGTNPYNYILNNVSGIGFYKAAGQTVATNRAYLQTTYNVAAEGARLVMVFADDETTGIADVRGKMEDGRSGYFDLQGRPVAQPTKGLYIVNGKKVVIK